MEATVSVALLISDIVRPTASMNDQPFDLAAAAASLESVQYLDCGSGSPADVAVTFAPTGRVSVVTVTNAATRSEVATCVADRFARAQSPPFTGEPRTLHCRIRLLP